MRYARMRLPCARRRSNPSVMSYDAVIVGSGPNGLAAAIELARNGHSVLVLEGHSRVGGGTRTDELTLPGFRHDYCSAVHPTGVLSPFFRQLPLGEHGLEWVRPLASVAHPLQNGDLALLYRDVERTADRLGRDGPRYRRLVAPFLRDPHKLLSNLLAPLKLPSMPLSMAWFGFKGLRPATWLARGHFESELARGLFAGCAAHSILPLEAFGTGAVGLVFAITAHVDEWPVARGGSESIATALASYLRSLGGEIRTDEEVTSLDQLPPHRVALFDTSPNVLVDAAGDALPASYRKRLEGFAYGPGVFKVDWALDGPIPWLNPRTLEASTVHVGGDIKAIAKSEREMWRGMHPDRPFLIVCQQSQFDDSRAPEGKQTGYAYCHVPAGSNVDMTMAIERQIERFAPDFRDRILARHVTGPAALERYNRNYVGGAITGGAMNLSQLFTRPVARLNPYTTPNPRLFLCSASTPPGGGVHGMCGYWAAQAALRQLRGDRPALPTGSVE